MRYFGATNGTRGEHLTIVIDEEQAVVLVVMSDAHAGEEIIGRFALHAFGQVWDALSAWRPAHTSLALQDCPCATCILARGRT